VSKTFCFAPWVHSYVGPNGDRALCCFAEPFDKETPDFSEYWNSEELRNARKLMREGKAPAKECAVCLGHLKTLKPPREIYDFAKHLEAKLLKETDSEGYFHGAPISLDYRVQNTCNLSCRTCNSLFSSKIANKLKSIEEGTRLLDPEKSRYYENEYHEFLAQGDTVRCYHASGEAFLQKSHFEALKEVVKSGGAQKLSLCYNTNLSYDLSLIEKHEKLLRNFKRVELAISIDGIGETGEFVRDGLSWHKFHQNVQKIKEIDYLHVSSLDLTLNLPTLLDFKPLAHFIYNERKPYNINKVFAGDYATLVSPEILKPSDFKKLLKDARKTLVDIDADFFCDFITFINLYLEEVGDSERWTFTEVLAGVKRSIVVDKVFAREDFFSFYSKFPLMDFYLQKLKTALEQEREVDLGKEYLYFEQKLKDYGFTEIERTYIHRPIPFDIGESDEAIVIGSYPSFLNRLLSSGKGKDEIKFKNYYALEKIQKREQFITLPPFQYLLRGKPFLSWLAPLLDSFTRPVRSLLALHFVVRVGKVLS